VYRLPPEVIQLVVPADEPTEQASLLAVSGIAAEIEAL